MNGIALGLALMMFPGVTSPGVAVLGDTVAHRAFSYHLADDGRTPSRALRDRWMNEQSRTVWRREASSPPQSKPAKRFSTTDRIIAVAAGVSLGWLVGGVIGGRLTESSNPDDDTSVLKGIMIGAPIGAVAGGIIGYRWTR